MQTRNQYFLFFNFPVPCIFGVLLPLFGTHHNVIPFGMVPNPCLYIKTLISQCILLRNLNLYRVIPLWESAKFLFIWYETYHFLPKVEIHSSLLYHYDIQFFILYDSFLGLVADLHLPVWKLTFLLSGRINFSGYC